MEKLTSINFGGTKILFDISTVNKFQNSIDSLRGHMTISPIIYVSIYELSDNYLNITQNM